MKSKSKKTSRSKSKTSKSKISRSKISRSKKTILPRLVKGRLEPYGYENIKHKSVLSRHRSLSKAIKTENPLSIYRRIIELATMNKNRDLVLFNILREDAEWIKTQPAYLDR